MKPPTPVMVTTLALETRSEANTHTFWSGRSNRAAKANVDVFDRMVRLGAPPPLPLVVRMTRLSAGVLDDDNLASAMKHVRDSIARWLKVNDRSPQVTWLVAQQFATGAPRVRLEVFRRGAPAPGVIVADESAVYAVASAFARLSAGAKVDVLVMNEMASALERAGLVTGDGP